MTVGTSIPPALHERSLRPGTGMGGMDGTPVACGRATIGWVDRIMPDRQGKTIMKTLLAVSVAGALLVPVACPPLVQAQPAMHDPNLPTVKPDVLRHLSDDRMRQQIIQDSHVPYAGRCVCPYETRDSKGRSCRGRHELIKD